MSRSALIHNLAICHVIVSGVVTARKYDDYIIFRMFNLKIFKKKICNQLFYVLDVEINLQIVYTDSINSITFYVALLISQWGQSGRGIKPHELCINIIIQYFPTSLLYKKLPLTSTCKDDPIFNCIHAPSRPRIRAWSILKIFWLCNTLSKLQYDIVYLK